MGTALRGQDAPDEESLDSLQRVRSRYNAPLASTAQVLRDQLGIHATSRLKTINTIIDKLKRETTRLSSIQDIAGLRVVVGLIDDQNSTSLLIASAFPRVTVVDRRRKPSHGYRAVHILVPVGDCIVEIQVRTRLQDFWAQVFERLADRVGRGIRYGGPALPTTQVGGVAASELVEIAARLSSGIAFLEERPGPKDLEAVRLRGEEVASLFDVFVKTGLLR